jgi:hypothetical protein
MTRAYTQRLVAPFASVIVMALIAACSSSSPQSESTPQPTGTAPAAALAQGRGPALAAVAGPDIPFVVPAPQAGHPPFADFAWREFIALNWPVELKSGTPVRGQADRTLTLGSAMNRPRVWETWKTDWELFGFGGPTPPNPTPWADWNTIGLDPCPGTALAPGSKVFTAQGTTGSKVRGLNQAFAGPLIDQHRNYARYEVRVNENEYTTIVNNKWYIASALPATLTFDTSVPGKYGAIELKASWRELAEGEDGARFYTSAAFKRDPGAANCVPTRVALIGLHIVHKTAPFGPWVWSTFEHIDNVPAVPAGSITHGGPFSFNNGTPTPASAPGFDHRPAILPPTTPLPPMGNPERNPVQVTRFVQTPPEVIAANDSFRKAPPVAGTVWANYMLVNNQWPTNPAAFDVNGTYPAGAGSPFPEVGVANSTMETYLQNKLVMDRTNSCMSCHYIAAKRDFSFLLADAWRPPTPPTGAGPTLPRELRDVQDAVRQSLDR